MNIKHQKHIATITHTLRYRGGHGNSRKRIRGKSEIRAILLDGDNSLRVCTTDGRTFGDHAVNPPFEVTPDQPGRTGLGNILQEVTNNDDASKHPSELGSFLCYQNFPGYLTLSIGDVHPFFLTKL